MKFVNKSADGKTMIEAWQETWEMVGHPSSVIYNPFYVNDKISSLQDTNNIDQEIKYWAYMNPGYDAPIYTSTGEEVYNGNGSRIYKVTKEYRLDNNPPRFPDILKVQEDGEAYTEDLWFADRNLPSAESKTRVPTLQWTYQYQHTREPIKGKVYLLPFQIDFDNGDRITNFELQIFEKERMRIYPKLTEEPFMDEVINYTVNPISNDKTIEWKIPDSKNLQWGKIYFWRVRAKDNNGNWGRWSPFNWFRVKM